MTSTLRTLTPSRRRGVRSATFLASAALLVACSSAGADGEAAPVGAPRPTSSSFGASGTVGAASPSPAPPPPFSNGTSTFPASLNGTPELVESSPDPAPASPEESSPVEDVEAGPATTVERCTASWYGEQHRGLLTASGVPFDPDQLTAAMWDVPFGTRVIVSTGSASVTVEITDRGPARRLGRCIDLSAAAFERLAPLGSGLVEVTVEVAP